MNSSGFSDEALKKCGLNPLTLAKLASKREALTAEAERELGAQVIAHFRTSHNMASITYLKYFKHAAQVAGEKILTADDIKKATIMPKGDTA